MLQLDTSSRSSKSSKTLSRTRSSRQRELEINSANSGDDNNDMLWEEKYMPAVATDLAVHNARVTSFHHYLLLERF